jgi:hypothetical protein
MNVTEHGKSMNRRGVVPTTVVATAEYLFRKIETGELDRRSEAPLKRLRSDPRIYSVWKVLLRQNENGAFFYPVRIEGLNPFLIPIRSLTAHSRILDKFGDRQSLAEQRRIRKRISEFRLKEKKAVRFISKLSSSQRQGLACSYLFFVAFGLALEALAILTAADLKISEALLDFAGIEVPASASRPDFELASEVLKSVEAKQPRTVLTTSDLEVASNYLEFTADELGRLARISSLLLGGAQVDVEEAMRALRRKARSVLAFQGSKLHVKRHRSDDELKAFAIKLDEIIKSLFGSSMYGTAASIANVALDRRDIKAFKIRTLLRRDPGPR